MPSPAAPISAPISFIGVLPKPKLKVLSSLDGWIAEILTGEYGVDDVIQDKPRGMKTAEQLLVLLRASVDFLESSGSQFAARAFLKATVTLCYTNRVDLPSIYGIFKEGLTSICNHIDNNKGELSPDKWTNGNLNDLRNAIRAVNSQNSKVILEPFLPVILKLAQASKSPHADLNNIETLAGIFAQFRNANDSELNQIIDVCPLFASRLAPPWNQGNYTTVPLTEAMAKRAYRLLEKDSTHPVLLNAKNELFNKFSLSWMTPEVVSEQIKLGKVSIDRFIEFSNASAEHFNQMNSIVFAERFNVHDTTHRGFNLTSFPRFKKYASDTAAMKSLFEPGFLMTDSSFGILNRIVGLRSIADAQPTHAAGRELLHIALSASFAELKSHVESKLPAQPFSDYVLIFDRMALEIIEDSIATLGTKVYGFPDCGLFKVTADPQFVAKLFKESGFTQFLNDKSRQQVVNLSSSRFEYSGAAHGVDETIRGALIESGAIHLGSLRRKDMTAAILGPVLTKHPERLAEVKNFDDFMRLSRMFKIPVNVPEGMAKASSVSDAMNTVIAAADPLAGADPLASIDAPVAKRRKALA